MATIHVLDSQTIDRIAAGEVVERPSSVVKELVENSIDAGAKAVTVEAKDGGIEFLRVTDNGVGMDKDQLPTAFLRHATSKIQCSEDLDHIESLGFRGEALSSISAVSRVEIVTKTASKLVGTRMIIEGADIKEIEEVGAPDGTTFIMRNLFFNTPVRRKFLKQPSTEGSYIADLMEHLALSRPDVSFKFVLGNQTKFHTSGNGDLKEVIYRLYGREIASNIIPVQFEEAGIKIEGYLGKPNIVRSNRNLEIYFINNRFIRSNIIAKSIEEGYKQYLMQHKFPFCVLHITVCPENVDVNVHPSKMDVRFSDQQAFSRLLVKAISSALQKKEMIPEAYLGEENNTEDRNPSENKKVRTPELFEVRRESAFIHNKTNEYKMVMEPKQDFKSSPVWDRVKQSSQVAKADALETLLQDDALKVDEDFFVEDAFVETETTENVTSAEAELKEEVTDVQINNDQPEEKITDIEQMNLFDEKLLTVENRQKYRLIGQVFDTYWLIQFEDKLFIIDQHAAHEKVKYERLMKQYEEKQVLSQRLMPPIIVSLGSNEVLALNENMNVFNELGFEIEEFGGNEYALRAVPVDLYGCNEREMFLEVLDELTDGGIRGNIRVIHEKIASMSCKAAVKGNNRLSVEEANELIDELLTLDNPYNCPHGRPTIITISQYEMEKKFKRIV